MSGPAFQTLPINAVKDEILNALNKGSAVITAPTGSGKSTQVPKFALETIPDDKIILVLQPRRLAARMLAERISFEMGDKPGGIVGYETRYEHVQSKSTRILFITEGILTRMLVATPDLPEIGAIIFDEFHERSIYTDLGIAMAKHVRDTRRPDLKLIVMSATIDAAPICAYLGNCDTIHSEGRLFDVAISYSKQNTREIGPAMAASKALSELMAEKLPGDILIFMPGGYEIRKTIELCSAIKFNEKVEFLPLYGDLPPEAQHKVMEPSDARKIIVATNIAETSLTIPGVRHVIDSGLAKTNNFDPVRGVNSLDTMPIARDSADQRAGRAGREGPGTCRRLWTWIEYSAMYAKTQPEIQHVDLADALLAIAAFGFSNPNDFPWFEKPPVRMLNGAMDMLTRLGMISPDGAITKLGRLLQSFPAHPRLSLLIWLGSQHGCLSMCAWAAAIFSERPMVTGSVSSPSQNRDRRYSSRDKNLPSSDFIVLMQLAQAAKDAHFSPAFCQRAGINGGAAADVCRAAADYERLALRKHWNCAQDDNAVENFLKCILQAFPDKLARRMDSGTLNCQLQNDRRGELSKESVVRYNNLFIASEIREVTGSGLQGSKLMLSMASGIQEDWLLDLFPDNWDDVDEIFWDDRKQQVFRRRRLSCLGLCLEEKISNDPDPNAAADILCKKLFEEIEAGRVPLSKWDEDVDRWIQRVRWVADIFPKENLPTFDENNRMEVYRILCEGETALRMLKNKDCLCYVKNILSYSQQQFVESMAPPFIMLPTGRRMKIEYIPGQTPKGRARIQDFYDLKQTPLIAGGRVKILLDILAPNMRTVQITDDLANFWNTLYPKIRTELARRYPKHVWR